MIDVHELLRNKENDIVRVRKEIQALRFVAPLLSEDEAQVLQPDTDEGAAALAIESDSAENHPHEEHLSQSGEILSEPNPSKVSRLRSMLGLAAGE